MSEQLKQQTLYDVSEANTKNLIWVDTYVSGTEGSAGVYATRRMTKAQLITFLNSNLSVAWSTIASKPTTVAGFGITDAVDTLGLTANYIPKATDANTLTDSQIRDDGSTIGINVAPNTLYRTYIKETGNKVPLRVDASQTSPSGNVTAVSIKNDTVNSNINYGSNFDSSGSTSQNVGIESRATGNGTSLSIGGVFLAEGATVNKYAIQLKDGTETISGGFLKNMTIDGKGNWVALAISDVDSLQTTLDAKSTYVPRTWVITSNSGITFGEAYDIITITALATGLTINNTISAFSEGYPLMIRIKDNGTARALTFGTKYRGIGITLPTTTVASKTMYLGMIYNATDDKWDVLGLNQEA